LSEQNGDEAVDAVDVEATWQRLASRPGSQPAAKAMAEAGYQACHNVAGGFEGPLDDDRHRGSVGGWKTAGLPWLQG
jgi:hypothetical protein